MSWADWLIRRLPPSWHTEQQTLRLRPIPDDLWARTLAGFPFLAWRSPQRQQRLRDLATVFLAHKTFAPAGGLRLTDDMAVAIAAQACLPVLRLGLGAYRDLHSIVIHPDEVVARREVVDDAGVVHRYDEVLAGEAVPGGPIMLSWHDVQHSAAVDHGYNVVVHEFAHALDMYNGEVDGTPPLPSDIPVSHWQDTLWQAFDRHSEALARGETPWLDPYACHSGLDEFFPVVTEAFFVAPHRLAAEHPAVHDLLARYFDDNPIAWQTGDLVNHTAHPVDRIDAP